jgi:hypothetical protein
VAVRFEVSRMMDTIEQRLTTDIVMAQAVVDLGEIARYTDLDGGRPVNLMRVGMVVDAFGRYLRDGGAMIYPVAPRTLLSEPELTSKERMVLGRWTDDGLIEATQEAGARVFEIAELTGLPVIGLRGHAEVADQYGWLRETPLRVLTVSPRGGGALLTDGKGGTGGVVLSRPCASPVASASAASAPAPAAAAPSPVTSAPSPAAEAETPVNDAPTGEHEAAGDGDVKAAADGEHSEADMATATAQRVVGKAAPADGSIIRYVGPAPARIWPDPTEPVYEPLPEPPDYLPAPSPEGMALIARSWRCAEFDCPSFGDGRRLGQPVPRLRNGKAVCPRHDEPLDDIGERPPSVPVTLIVDGLRRRHFVVMADRPVFVGRAPEEPDSIAVNEWLHEAASNWISRTHLKLEISDDRLVATDLSTNGTLVWVRTQPGDRPDRFRLTRGNSYPMGEWDSAELYTGIELCRADRRPKGVDESHDELSSVLTDAPTIAIRQLSLDH